MEIFRFHALRSHHLIEVGFIYVLRFEYKAIKKQMIYPFVGGTLLPAAVSVLESRKKEKQNVSISGELFV